MKVEALKELIEKGKKTDFLTYQEITDALDGIELSPDDIEDIYEQFAAEEIEVVGKEEAEEKKKRRKRKMIR